MFTDKELKHLKNIVTILTNESLTYTLKGPEILPIASTLTVLQTSIIPKVEQLVKEAEKKPIPAPTVLDAGKPEKPAKKAKASK